MSWSKEEFPALLSGQAKPISALRASPYCYVCAVTALAAARLSQGARPETRSCQPCMTIRR
eukprot:4472550-Amphidinium_carterae.3